MRFKNEIILVIFIALVISVWFFINWRRKKMTIGTKQYTFKNASTAGHIAQLHPSVRKNFADFVEEVESPQNGDLEVYVTSSYRSPEKQHAMFLAKETPTAISLHNFGFAFDINVNGTDVKGNKVALRMKTASSDLDQTDFNDWAKIVAIAKKYNLSWGGKFIGYADRVHFQYLTAKKASEYLAIFNAGKKDKEGFVIV